MTPSVLVFGAVGTEVILDDQRYEIVVVGRDGLTTWRTRCEICWATMFTQSRRGELPIGRRCQVHQMQDGGWPRVPSDAEKGEAVSEAVARQKVGMSSVRDFLPMPSNVSRETLSDDEVGSMAPSEDEIMEPRRNGFDVASLSAELAELASEDGEEDLTPRPTSDDVWEKRVQMFMESRMWVSEWGPRPNQAGCEVPEEVMERFRR